MERVQSSSLVAAGDAGMPSIDLESKKAFPMLENASFILMYGRLGEDKNPTKPVTDGLSLNLKNMHCKRMSISLDQAFSKERIATYRNFFVGPVQRSPSNEGYGLYAWNSRVSSAFLHSLHVFEVVLRNAICEALEAQYGENWVYSVGFRRSLATGSVQDAELLEVAGSESTPQHEQKKVGDVISKLSFFFWEQMFLEKFRKRLWDRHLFNVFPGLNVNVSVKDHLADLRSFVEHIRKFRNRIAHHEPIFLRNLSSDKGVIQKLIRLRSEDAYDWAVSYDVVNSLLRQKPFV